MTSQGFVTLNIPLERKILTMQMQLRLNTAMLTNEILLLIFGTVVIKINDE